MRKRIFFLIWAVLWLVAGIVHAYPLDGYDHTGIPRLEALLLVQEKKIPGPTRVTGALLELDQVDVRLSTRSNFTLPEPDFGLAARIQVLLGEDAQGYTLALLDLTDPGAPRFAQIKGDHLANPGSVGKLAVALALFQALADTYPDSIEKRTAILRSTQVRADAFIQTDHHTVPFWDRSRQKLSFRPIRQGDMATLWTYLDWMMSASSNAAAAMVQKEVMLLKRFGREYPVSQERANAFFKNTPKTELKEIFAKSHQEPLMRNGLDPEEFRQGSFFTRSGKNRVLGTTSHASPNGLIHFLVKLEQGQLVDLFSSQEIKRLLYMTGKRIRYASSPALNESAVYFKSGSLYKCKPEPGFTCQKYQGNVLNQLASVAIVEQSSKEPHLHYMVAIMSNVLYKNSAVAHQTLATRIHRLLEKEYKK